MTLRGLDGPYLATAIRALPDRRTLPIVLMSSDDNPERHRRVDAPAGDDDVRARVERARDRCRPEIRVDAEWRRRKRRAREHLARSEFADLLHLRH